MSLCEAAELEKPSEAVVGDMAKTNNLSGSSNPHASSSNSFTSEPHLLTDDILKPQLNFKDKINNSAGAFVPKIKEKPHSFKPLEITTETNELGEDEFCHPYEYELTNFSPDPKFFISQSSVLSFKKVDEVPLVMVENEESLKLLVKDLSTQIVIGVDLEAHHHRSFQGITCLMQISTDATDYIVDTLELWGKLQSLNHVFCNPMIVKIFHGAGNDILWLQRDFGLYVVNMFDTQHAAKKLNFPKPSLASLLQHYCSVVVDKQYQIADWRIRPLPQQMLTYAREDTHYLGYIFERMKEDMKVTANNDNLLLAVWELSKLTCLKRYRIPQLTRDSHMKLFNKHKKSFSKRQLYALKELVAWRDRVAREEDESLHFVLPTKMILELASDLPEEPQGILATCSPIPPLVRKLIHQLQEIIRKASNVSRSSLPNQGQSVVTPTPKTRSNEVHHAKELALSPSQGIGNGLPTLLTPPCTERPSIAVVQVKTASQIVIKKQLPAQADESDPTSKAETLSDATLDPKLKVTSSEPDAIIKKKRKRENEEEEREESNSSAPETPNKKTH